MFAQNIDAPRPRNPASEAMAFLVHRLETGQQNHSPNPRKIGFARTQKSISLASLFVELLSAESERRRHSLVQWDSRGMILSAFDGMWEEWES